MGSAAPPAPSGPAPSPRLDLSIASPMILRMLSSPSSYLHIHASTHNK